MSDPLASLSVFWDLLERHDWFYFDTKDMGAYQRGEEKHIAIRNVARQSRAHFDMYRAFCNHHYNGGPWRTEQPPKPERPK